MKTSYKQKINEKAAILCDGGHVEINGYIVRLSEIHNKIGCKNCQMYNRCDLDMATICGMCDMIINKPCFLELLDDRNNLQL